MRSASPPTSNGASPRPPPRQVDDQQAALRRSGADVIELATESDWLGAIIQHVRRRRVQAVNAQVLRR